MEDEEEHNTSTFSRGKMPAAIEKEEVMELIWEKDTPVIVSVGPGGGSNQAGPSGVQQQHLFMEEDEMASWLQLHHNNNNNDLINTFNFHPTDLNLLYPAVPSPLPVLPPPRKQEYTLNFPHFSRFPIRIEPRPARHRPVLETTTHHNEMPTADMMIRSNEQQLVTLVPPSPSTSIITCTAIADPPNQPQYFMPEDRKGKALEESEDNRHWTPHEGIRSEPIAEAQRQGQGSVLTGRSRKSQVHNLSERRRRNRINEKIRTLKELIPGCNKSDKASIMDDAIEYMKSLQMQMQMMMHVGYGVLPMMYPGIQQYMHAMEMGMSINRPIVPYPNILPGSMGIIPADTNPRFSMPAFHLPQVSQPDPFRIASDHNAIMLNLLLGGNPNQTQSPNFVSASQHFLGPHQAQTSSTQNQESVQPSDNNPSSNIDNPENTNAG